MGRARAVFGLAVAEYLARVRGGCAEWRSRAVAGMKGGWRCGCMPVRGRPGAKRGWPRSCPGPKSAVLRPDEWLGLQGPQFVAQLLVVRVVAQGGLVGGNGLGALAAAGVQVAPAGLHDAGFGKLLPGQVQQPFGGS